MNFVSPRAMCNCTLSEASSLLKKYTAAGATGGQIVCCPIAQAGLQSNLVPQSDFVKEGVPLLTPAYFMIQFPGSEKYPWSYTCGIAQVDIDNGMPILETLQ